MSVYAVDAERWAGGRIALCARRPGRPSGLSCLSCLICLAILTPVLLGCISAQAVASSTSQPTAELEYSPTPSTTEPYTACPPPTADRAECLAIVDPVSAIPAPLARATPAAGVSPQAGVSPECFTDENELCGGGYRHGFAPQDLQAAYRLPSLKAGKGQTVAVIDAYDDPNAQADLKVYRSTYDLPPCEAGCFAKVNQEGGTTMPEANSGWALEISLDLDMVSAACPNCHLLLVEADNNQLKNLGIAENEAATAEATEISNSYAAREIEVGKAQLEEDSKYYRHLGVPITVASGDNGYDGDQGGTWNGKKCVNCSPDYPADLSSVISVGGTELWPEEELERGWGEWVWFNSGSGCTLYVAKPKWQTDKGCANRTDSDLAADAASASPVSVYDTYSTLAPGWQNAGGTSAASPLVAGAIALESGALRSEGVEGIYSHPGNWFDVTWGPNWHVEECVQTYLCNGEVGYDGPTGIGTPDEGATATPPSALTERASGVTKASGTLNGVVNPEASGTKYYFQYGASTSYGQETPVGGLKITARTVPAYVSQTLSGLAPQVLYHYRVVATNAGGTTYGADRTFSTAPKVYQSKFGSKGASEGSFEGPFDAAADGYGDVWVTDYSNDRVEEYSPAGALLQACGSAGSGRGQFAGPTGIAINPINGNVYVSDSGNDRIEIVEPDCSISKEVIGKPGSSAGELSDPMGLAFTPAGEFSQPLLLVADAGNNRIEEFNWYGSHDEYVMSYGSTGTEEGQFKDPTDVVLASGDGSYADNFYAVDSGNDRVQEFAETDLESGEKASIKALLRFGSRGAEEGELSDPTNIAVDPSTGDVNVTDTGNDRVDEFLPNGTYVGAFGAAGAGNEEFEAPRGIAIDAHGEVYVTDYMADRVDVWGPSQEDAPEWLLTATPNPTKALNSDPNGVSCASATACAMVGSYNTTTESYRPFAESWNGMKWQLQSAPIPSGSSLTLLYGVSCASSTACMTAGYYENGSGRYLFLVEHWNGTEWQIQSVPEPSGALGSLLVGVSCTSSSACTAVGWYENSAGVEVPLAERWNGTAWSVQTTANPTGVKASYPYAVSCSSLTACTMAGYEVNSAGVEAPFAEGWNGSEWSVESMPTPTGATRTLVNGVSCTSSTVCMAVGSYENSAGVNAPFAERWNAVAWSLQLPPAPPGARNSYLEGVSCASSTACTAVGIFLNSSKDYVTLAEYWNGTEWEVQPTPNGEHEEGGLSGVSCTSSTSCTSVGGSDGKTLAEIYGSG